MARTAFVFLLPTLLLLCVFSYYPFFSALYHSLFRWDGMGINEFIGFENFRNLFSDRELWIAARNVGIMLIFNILKVLTAPLLVAELLFSLRNARTAYIYRVLFVLPMVVPGVVGILIWSSFYGAETGLINKLLDLLHLSNLKHAWLGDPRTALGAIIFMGFPWVGALPMLIYLAGLLNIPKSVMEAALVDGASFWHRFIHIDLPLLAGQIKLVLILTVIGTIQSFEVQMIMTDGGPGNATLVPGLHMYHHAFRYSNLGYASAIAVVMFLVMFTLTYLNMRYLKGKVEY